MEAFRTAYVYVRKVFAGILYETDSGYSFSYDKDYLKMENAAAVICSTLSQVTSRHLEKKF